MGRLGPRHGGDLEGRGWRVMPAGLAYADAPLLTPYSGCARELLLARRRAPEDLLRGGLRAGSVAPPARDGSAG